MSLNNPSLNGESKAVEEADQGKRSSARLALHSEQLRANRTSILAGVEHSLPLESQKQFEKLEQLFTVDTQMLKNITARFGKELQDGKSDVLL